VLAALRRNRTAGFGLFAMRRSRFFTRRMDCSIALFVAGILGSR